MVYKVFEIKNINPYEQFFVYNECKSFILVIN